MSEGDIHCLIVLKECVTANFTFSLCRADGIYYNSGSLCRIKGRCSDCNRCLCPAQSKAVTKAPEDFISFELPPNAGITKIYASLVQNPAAPIDGVEILIIGPLELEFAHWFSKDPLARVGSFETTLVQPLCIGEEGATLLYTTLNQVDATILSITVVYCPDYCAE